MRAESAGDLPPAALVVQRVEHAVPLRGAARVADAFEALLDGVPHARIGEVTDSGRLQIVDDAAGSAFVDADLKTLKEAWQKPLRW